MFYAKKLGGIKMIKYFNEIRLDNGHIYSLDMIRLNLQFGDNAQEFMNWLSMYNISADGIEIENWLSIKQFSYRNLFRVKTEDYSFSFAVGFNGGSLDKNKGFVEFNPNKCQGEHFTNIWIRLIDATLSVDVVRYDLAIDIPYPRYLVKLQKDNRNYTFLSAKGADTEYLGQRNNVGYIKVYDKKKEADLNYDVTRIEITANLDGINFPDIKIMPMQEKLDFGHLSKTDKVLIQLLKQVDNPMMYLKQLTYRERKKILDYICEDTLKLDENAYWLIRKQVLSYKY